MTKLLDLCYDVLLQILEEINPEDVAACIQTSRGFRDFIRENTRIYKTLYLKHFREEFTFVTTAVDDLIATMSYDNLGLSHNKALITELFQHISQNHDAFMCRSSLWSRMKTAKYKPADNEEGRQISAKLLSFFGFPPSNVGKKGLPTHSYARSRVYDLRNYTDKNKWGPFRNDGSMRVDWEMIESIMVVIGYNSLFGVTTLPQALPYRLQPPWFQPLDGLIPDIKDPLENGQRDYIALLQQPDLPLDMKDPYRVQGIWSRIVCFLDYTNLYHFNFDTEARRLPADEPRPALLTDEAIRHILMDLRVTDVTAPGPSDNPALPVVHFKGMSRAIDAQWDPNANSGIRGTVRLTAEGEVRWQTISVFQGGEERWRSDGIQVGGLRSPRGVVGTWFDKDFDVHGPAGPTAFWKISDEIPDSDDEDDTEDDFWGH
ncbi:uncharacterized protein yc1106_06729 [Curvularia clavata]|uniref:F-box domain-containing protein n=1 Tax=Curvularia clavata TaxID=95742 RepID=A0A9Q8ZC09_CURCL|nr:uncharacterized protein yc1106_06729 [Curvularia clavata]